MAPILSGSDRARFENLRDAYDAALVQWPDVVSVAAVRSDESAWIDPFRAGLLLYGHGEGW